MPEQPTVFIVDDDPAVHRQDVTLERRACTPRHDRNAGPRTDLGRGRHRTCQRRTNDTPDAQVGQRFPHRCGLHAPQIVQRIVDPALQQARSIGAGATMANQYQHVGGVPSVSWRSIRPLRAKTERLAGSDNPKRP